MLTGLRHAARSYEFVRHMPVTKLMRRLELDVRRRFRDRFPRPVDAAGAAQPLRPAPYPPLPLFASRRGAHAIDGGCHVFTFLNRAVRMGPKVDWQAPGAGAEVQLWRMHLHYMEYLEAADDAQVQALIADWIAANPASRPGAWRDAWNSYALSLRVVVWMQQLALRKPRLDPDFVHRAHAGLTGQLAYLADNLETDLGGNHLVKNLKALIWAGAYFDDQRTRAWQRRAIGLLATELARQILPDGMHAERSPSYHAQVLADLIECRQALGRDPFGGRLDQALARMNAPCQTLMHPDGGPALFNDAGLTMAYAPADCASACATVLGLAPSLPDGGFALRDAGYFGLRTADTYFVADCGRIGPDDLPAHGHGDVLSFEWSVAGRRIIVDPGVFEYFEGDRRTHARSAHSHNTLALDGCDQADFFGSFRCGRRPDVTVHDCTLHKSSLELEGSHDGFCHRPGRPRHVRRFGVDHGALAITDRIEGKPDVGGEIGFLLHPDVSVEADGADVLLHSGPVTIRCRADAPIANVPACWWPDLGVELPTQRLVLRLTDARLASPFHVRFDVVRGAGP